MNMNWACIFFFITKILPKQNGCDLITILYDSTSGRTGSHHGGHPSLWWDYTMIQMEPRYYLFPSDGIEVDSLLLSDFRILFKMYSALILQKWMGA